MKHSVYKGDATRGTQITGPYLGHPTLGGCQNYDPFWGTLNSRCRIIIGTQKGTIILTTTLHKTLQAPQLEARLASGRVARQELPEIAGMSRERLFFKGVGLIRVFECVSIIKV